MDAGLPEFGKVVGFGRTPSTLRIAQELGVIDRAGINPAHEIGDADIVLVATPVAQMPEIFERIAPYLGPNTIVTDGGSTKDDVVAAARTAFKRHIGKFVRAHSIGGADIYALTPEMHDRVFAAVSHLPHLLSFALVHDLAVRDDADLFFTFAASGFRDFTRIAASHPEMWRDICLANRVALLGELDSYRAQLEELHVALSQNDGVRLEEIFGIARQARRSWAC